ncbi:uncharacterized protein ARMOST_17902 [Armillaria ostoyae]|uniref:Integrase core domain-containing protein n=1 Tax=Armillaria ostoyae TaxID=47428 RepID=A0A284S0A8_ARMOS|nr:uncharacterized protein ARMOST_17902 [Armillaria ostoyae]
MSDVSDEDLDKLIDGILARCPGQRIAAARKRVHGPNHTFGQRLLARKTYTSPGANSIWHHDGNHRLIRWKMLLHIFVDGQN